MRSTWTRQLKNHDFVRAARQLEFFKGRSNSGHNTDSLADALAIAQHHDAVTDTEKQHAEELAASSLACLAQSASNTECGNPSMKFQQILLDPSEIRTVPPPFFYKTLSSELTLLHISFASSMIDRVLSFFIVQKCSALCSQTAVSTWTSPASPNRHLPLGPRHEHLRRRSLRPSPRALHIPPHLLPPPAGQGLAVYIQAPGSAFQFCGAVTLAPPPRCSSGVAGTYRRWAAAADGGGCGAAVGEDWGVDTTGSFGNPNCAASPLFYKTLSSELTLLHISFASSMIDRVLSFFIVQKCSALCSQTAVSNGHLQLLQIDTFHWVLDMNTFVGEAYDQVRELCIFLLNSFTLPPDKASPSTSRPPAPPSSSAARSPWLPLRGAVVGVAGTYRRWAAAADGGGCGAAVGEDWGVGGGLGDAARRWRGGGEEGGAVGDEGRGELFNFMQSFCGVDGSCKVLSFGGA
ncbi:alpha-mannosidase [Quercus suber]|uniref:Alpha-mannosidase n=1 Tax=Quercus suber TaxID=58331 RepID=A0AAW0LRP5_QUESU